MAAGLEPPLLVWPSALQPLERIPRVWERKLVLSCSKRAAEEAEGAVLPAWVKGSLTGLLSTHPKPLSTREDRSAHHLHSSPNILPGLWTDAPRRKPSPYLISPVLPSEFVKVTSKQLSPGPRGPGVSPWYLPVPGQPCQVEGAGLLGSRPPKPRVRSVTLGWSAALPHPQCQHGPVGLNSPARGRKGSLNPFCQRVSLAGHKDAVRCPQAPAPFSLATHDTARTPGGAASGTARGGTRGRTAPGSPPAAGLASSAEAMPGLRWDVRLPWPAALPHPPTPRTWSFSPSSMFSFRSAAKFPASPVPASGRSLQTLQ